MLGVSLNFLITACVLLSFVALWLYKAVYFIGLKVHNCGTVGCLDVRVLDTVFTPMVHATMFQSLDFKKHLVYTDLFCKSRHIYLIA